MNGDLTRQQPQRRCFIPVELPKFEIRFCFAVWIFHSLAAFVIALNVSNKLNVIVHHWSTRSEYIKGYYFDNADPEWSLYRKSAHKLVIAYLVHSCVFYQLKRFPPRLQQYFSIALWLLISLYLASAPCLAIFILFALVVTYVTICTRSELLAWILCIAFVLKANNYAYFTNAPTVYYREFNFYLYGAIKVLNFCIYLCRNPSVQINTSLLLRYMQYLFYPPYSIILIVLFEDFNAQMNNAQQFVPISENPSRLRNLATHLIRIVFWFFALEFILHFIYVNFLFEGEPGILQMLGNYEIASVAYVQGQLFFVKYVILFGLPSWFAKLDGMEPPGPPICISRVSRYSRMWRCFDRGLYQFLKNQVYIPLGGQQNSRHFQVRRFLAMIFAFLFVLAWHGTSSAYVSWVLLSGIELCVERIGSMINGTNRWWRFSEAIGLVNQRRIVAVAMSATVIPGIFGVFYFLGREGIGATVFNRILVDGFKNITHLEIGIVDAQPTAGFVFIHLLMLAYCFNNVCLQLDDSLKRIEHTE